MNRFATGMVIGGLATMAGISYLVQDQRTYRKMMKKGKRMAIKAEEVIDDIMEDMTDR